MSEVKHVSISTQTVSADLRDKSWTHQIPFRQRPNLEGYQLVWCDDNEVTQNAENSITLTKLRDIVNYTQLFNDISSCRRYIEQTSDTTTFLVCAVNMAFSLIPQVHELKNIKLIYIHSNGKSPDSSQILANFRR